MHPVQSESGIDSTIINVKHKRQCFQTILAFIFALFWNERQSDAIFVGGSTSNRWWIQRFEKKKMNKISHRPRYVSWEFILSHLYTHKLTVTQLIRIYGENGLGARAGRAKNKMKLAWTQANNSAKNTAQDTSRQQRKGPKTPGKEIWKKKCGSQVSRTAEERWSCCSRKQSWIETSCSCSTAVRQKDIS